jgi:hypothetical protein
VARVKEAPELKRWTNHVIQDNLSVDRNFVGVDSK